MSKPTFQKPSAIEQAFGKALMALVRAGIVRGHFYVLEVRGRKSRKIISLPVDPLDLDGARYLICARGESNWVKNVRAAGEIALVQGRFRQRYAAIEIPVERRPRLLKAYLDRFASEVQRFFAVPKGSAEGAFAPIAAQHPVFELKALGG